MTVLTQPLRFQQSPYAGMANQQYQQPERQPGMLESTLQGFGGGLGEGIAGGLRQEMRKSMLEKTLSMLNPNMSVLEKYDVISKADPETQAALIPRLQLEQEQMKAQQTQQNAQRNAEIQRQHDIAKINLQNKGKLEAAQTRVGAKGAAESAAKSSSTQLPPEQKKEITNILKNEFKLIKEGHLGNPYTTGGILNPKRQRALGNVKAQNLKIYEIARKMEQTGHMTDANFKALQSALVDPEAMDEDNIGRLQGLAEIMGIDPEEIFGETKKNKKEKTAALQSGQQFDNLPDAAEVGKGGVIKLPTGQKVISNGKTWQEFKQ